MKTNVEMNLCLFHDMTLERLAIARSLENDPLPPVQVAAVAMRKEGCLVQDARFLGGLWMC